MKLLITVQEVVDKDTQVRYKMAFCSLDVTLPTKEGGKRNKMKRINFMMPTKEVGGLDRIVEGLITSALALDKKNQGDESVTNGPIKIPNRKDERA